MNEQEARESVETQPTEDRISGILDDDIATAVEALLFASPQPLSDQEMARIIGKEKRQVADIVEDLNHRYAEWGRSFRIEKFGDKYRFYTLAEFDAYITRLAEIPRPVRLSPAALEVLSVIAYRQPVIKSEIDKIRGVNSDGVVRNLLERELIEICGRSDGPGRPFFYGTTREFLEYFGIPDIAQLPMPEKTTGEGARGLVLRRPPGQPDSASGDSAAWPHSHEIE